MPRPTSYHDERLRAADDQHFFDVITDGYGAMYSYASRVPPRDRWAIVAYIRALQLSRHASIDDVPPDAAHATRRERHEGRPCWCRGRGAGSDRRSLDRSALHDRLLSRSVVACSAIPVGVLGVLMMTYLVRGAWTEELHGFIDGSDT